MNKLIVVLDNSLFKIEMNLQGVNSSERNPLCPSGGWAGFALCFSLLSYGRFLDQLCET